MINKTKIEAIAIFPNFCSSYQYLDCIINVRMLIILKSSNRSPPCTLTIEPTILNDI